MGLFHSIFKAIPVLGDIVSAHDSKKATSAANAATQLGITNAKGDLNSQLATTTANLTPWVNGGQQAFGQEGDILGLHGAGAQGSILDQLKASPMFQSLFRTGQDTVLNNASATGGLRGGNIIDHLANFGSDTLAQVIQNQLQNLSGMSTQGLGAATNLAGFGAQNASQLAGLDTGSGQANAGMILGRQAIDNNLFSGLRQKVQQAASAAAGAPGGGGGGGFDLSSLASLFGGSGGGGSVRPLDLSSMPKINIALPSAGSGLPF
jgi:hypothetical protein